MADQKQEEAFRVIDRRPFTSEGELRKEVVEEEEREAQREAAKHPRGHLARLVQSGDDDDASSGDSGDAFSRLAAEHRAVFARALGDVKRIGTGAAIQARCLECDGLGGAAPAPGDAKLMDLILARFTQ